MLTNENGLFYSNKWEKKIIYKNKFYDVIYLNFNEAHKFLAVSYAV